MSAKISSPDVPNQFNQLVAEEVGSQLRHMTEHRANSKESGGAIQVFQVPVEEGEDKAISKAHEPCHEEHRAILDTTKQFYEVPKAERLRLAHTSCRSVVRGFIGGAPVHL